MKFSKTTKCILICMLILLTIVIRLPSYSHERGSPDEFSIHSVANSVSKLGYANWWMNIYAIFGLYPYSYGSATPFIFSGVSQSTELDMESTAWVFTAILGIFITLSAYIMAGQIRDDDLFKFLVAFLISIAPGVINYTTWQVSARGTFLAFLPLMIYLILKTRTITKRIICLILFLFVLLLATHHFVYFIIPIIIGFILTLILFKLKSIEIFKKIKVPNNFFSMILALSVASGFLMPFFSRMLIRSSRYAEVIYIIERSIRYVGLIFPIAIGGIIYIIFKRKKEFGDVFLIFSLALFAPLMYEEVYYPFFGAVLLCIFIGVGLVNIIKIGVKKKKIFAVFVVIVFIFVGFSSFFQHYRTGSNPGSFYMEESVYNAGTWIKNNLKEDNKMVSNDFFIASKILSVSGIPILTLPFSDFVYGFIDINKEIKVVKNSFLSQEFYRDNPYVLSKEVLNPMYYQSAIQKFDIDSSQAKAIIAYKNLTHVVESDYSGDNLFISSLKRSKYNEIFNNGKVHIWGINKVKDKEIETLK